MGSLEFVLALPHPYNNIQITRPRLEDASHIVPILNDNGIGIWMGPGLPLPHELHHAQRWLEGVRKECDTGQEDLRRLRSLDLSPDNYWKADKADNESNESNEDREAEPYVIRGCPVRIIRELVNNQEIYLGDIGLTKWKFQDILDEQEREQQILINSSKKPGDPTIIWSIGYYLKSSHHGRGIMKTAIQTLLSWAGLNMNVKHLRATAMEDNPPSLRVLQQNGFIVEKILPKFASRAGIKVGLVVLERKEKL